jgi:histidinol phosphatase-like enzyme (inositol monophosphatase family)
MSGDSALLLQAVGELARLMGAAALRHYRPGIAVERKGDGSPVTIADREAERAARAWLAAHFPRDAVLGEEFGPQPGAGGRTWLLDPIDGTKTFVRGVPLWGSLVAVVESDTVLAGAAAYPALGELLSAAPGGGCWHDGARCRVSDVARLEAATVLTSDIERLTAADRRRGWQALADGAEMSRTWGDCWGYFLVATGRAEVMVDVGLNPWDVACFVPIIEEAGGTISDFSGRRYPPLRDAIAVNGALTAEVGRLLGAGREGG